MSDTGHSEHRRSVSPAAFSALVEYLKENFGAAGVVCIPSKVIEPFEPPFRPSSSLSLRDLLKVLDHGRPPIILRLAPASFCAIVSIVLQFPFSPVQNKLLYLFMNIIRQYRDEKLLLAHLSRIPAENVTLDTIRTQRDVVGQELAPCVLRRLVSCKTDLNTRWRLGQLLSVILWDDKPTCIHLGRTTEWKDFASVLEGGEDYFVRILVANIARLLICSGADHPPFGGVSSILTRIENLSKDNAAESIWISRMINLLSDTDLGRAFIERSERVYRVQRLEYGGKPYFTSSSAFLAVISEEVNLLVPNESDRLTLFTVPVTQDMSLTPVASESETFMSTIVHIQYTANTGYRVVNGLKSAIDNITLTFCDEESVEAFREGLEQQRTQNTLRTGPKVDLSTGGNVERELPLKRSMAFIDMTLDSGDDGGVASGAKDATSNDGNTSGTGCSSPLQTKGLQVVSSLDKQPATSLVPAGDGSASDGTASDMPLLRKPRDYGAFVERLRASQEDPTPQVSEDAGTARTPDRRKTLDKKPPQLSTEGATQKEALPGPAVRTAASVHEDRVRDPNHGASPLGTHPSPSKLSVHRLPSVPAAEPKPNSGKRRSGTSNTTAREQPSKAPRISRAGTSRAATVMASSISPQPDGESRVSTSTLQTRVVLKRRTPKEPASADGPPLKPADGVSITDDYDLPLAEKDQTRSRKRARTEKSKQPVKNTTGKDAAREEKTSQKGALSQKRPNWDVKRKHNAPKTPSKQELATVASTRARRAAKTPKYVEESGSSDEEPSDGSTRVSTEQGIPSEEDNDLEQCAEDSHPLSKEALDTALEAPSLNFESTLQELVDIAGRDPRTASAKKHTSTTVLVTPRHAAKRLSEACIPPVSEKLIRKTPIVHFGPRGPGNQAVLPKPTVEEIPESYPWEDEPPQTQDEEFEIRPSSPDYELVQGAVCDQDVDSTVDRDGLTNVEIGGEPRVMHDPSVSSSSNVSTPEVTGQQQVSEYVDFEGDDGDADASPALRKSAGVGLRPPLLNDEASDAPGKVKETILRQAPTRRSIGISAILDEEYPRAEKIINPKKIRSSLRQDTESSVAETVDCSTVDPSVMRADFDKIETACHPRSEVSTQPQKASSTLPARLPRTSYLVKEGDLMGPPPPRTVPSRSAGVPAPVGATTTISAEEKPPTDVQEETTHTQKTVKSAPVRIKKTVLSTKKVAPSEPELFPGTPLPFCTRLDMKAPVPVENGLEGAGTTAAEGRAIAQRSGDRSLTLANDESISGDRSVPWARRGGRQSSESADDMSSVASPSQRQTFPPLKDDRVPREINVRESQRGLLDAILGITNDVLFRFGEEEDAVKAKVAELQRGGDGIIQTLTDSWNERLGHEHQSLLKGLVGEREVVTGVVQLVNGQDSRSWKDIIVSPGAIAKTGDKRHALVSRIEALRKTHPQLQ